MRLRLSLWCYYRGWVNLAERIYPGVYWYVVGLGLSNFAKTIRQAAKALGEGWTVGQEEVRQADGAENAGQP